MSLVTYQISFPEGFFLFLIVFLNRGYFIVHSSLFHVSWQPRNIRRSPSDFFYPKSLIRRTGWSPSLQVGAVSGLRLGATVLGPRLLLLFLPLLLSPHNFRAPAEADAFSHPTECISHSDSGCFLLWTMFSFRAVAKALPSVQRAHWKLSFWSYAHTFVR